MLFGELLTDMRLTKIIYDHSVNGSKFAISLGSVAAEDNSSLPTTRSETEKLSMLHDLSTGQVFSGEKVRDFSLPRANLKKTIHSTEAPLENVVKRKCTNGVW